MKSTSPDKDFHQLKNALAQFVQERAWEPFHTPKNLAMALSVEVAEIIELFQWLTPEQSQDLPQEKRAALANEIGDVMIYLTMLAAKLDLDPLEAAWEKMEINRKKYPAQQVRGKSLKYFEYETWKNPNRS